MPYMIYADPVIRYEQLFYEMELVVPYERVLDQNRTVSQLDWIDSASISDVVRFNSAIIRGEHFGEGILGNAIDAGAIAAIVKKLREWRTSKLARGGSAPSEFAAWMRSFRDGCPWQAAKSGPPHEYTVRKWRPEASDDFERAVAGIREFGYAQAFYGNTYIYFNLDGLKYWTMGDPLTETTVLNRDPVENRYELLQLWRNRSCCNYLSHAPYIFGSIYEFRADIRQDTFRTKRIGGATPPTTNMPSRTIEASGSLPMMEARASHDVV